MLHDAYLRITRAEELLDELRRLAADYESTNKASSLIKVNGMTVSALWPPEPPSMFGVRVGEIAHNLRSALDYLVYQLARLDSGNFVSGTQFPIEESAKGFRSRSKRCLAGIDRPHIAAIETLQPYNSGQWARVLRDLSNQDKHRTLHIIGYAASESVRVNVGGTEEEGRALGGFRKPGDDESMYYPAPIVVAFTDGTPIEATLSGLVNETRRVLDAFSSDFAGQFLERSVKQTLSALPIRVK
jgi:hypothetical protein